MCEIKCVKSKVMFPVVKELLNTGKRVRITVTGMSMYPFLRGNRDSVELSRINYKSIKTGDIVLVQIDGHYILHRVFRINKGKFYLNGDAQKTLEGPLEPRQMIAKVTSVWREKRYISCSDIRWRVLSYLWQKLFPVRNPIMKTYGRIRRSFLMPYIRRTFS